MSKIIIAEKLDELLIKNWAYFINKTQLIRQVLEDTRKSNFKESKQSELPDRNIKLSVTKMEAQNNEFEMWAEFTVPINKGVAIGTHVYSLNLSGELNLKQSYGHVFVPEN